MRNSRNFLFLLFFLLWLGGWEDASEICERWSLGEHSLCQCFASVCLAQVATYATKTQDLHMLYSQTVWLAHLRYTFQTCVLLVEQRQTGRLLQGRNEKEVGRRLLRPSSQPQSEHFRDEFILELSKKLVNTCFFFNVFLKALFVSAKRKSCQLWGSVSKGVHKSTNAVRAIKAARALGEGLRTTSNGTVNKCVNVNLSISAIFYM